VLSNEGIVALSEAGYDQSFIVDLIRQKQTRFDTSVEGLAFLADHGIPENIVRFMIANENKPAALPLAGDAALAPVAVPMRVVRRKVLVPDTRMTSLPTLGPPVMVMEARPEASVVTALTAAPIYQSPASAPTQSIVLGRDNRWYVVVSPSATVVNNAGGSSPVNSYINYFPVW
jgi:hypothetical protein